MSVVQYILIAYFILLIVALCTCAQSCPTLCNPMDCNPPGSSVHGILLARILEGAAIFSSRASPLPRDRTCVFYISCIGGEGSLLMAPSGSPL